MPDQDIKDFVNNYRVVGLDDNYSKWNIIDGIQPVGELIQNFPLGIVYNITGISNQKKGLVFLKGLMKLTDYSILESGSSPTLYKPYFLSVNQAGKITLDRPEAAVHIGYFITATDFLVNIQYLTESHIHRRVLLDPTKWVDNTTEILYPISELNQLPLPYDGTVLVLDNTFTPPYGRYVVDPTGIRLLDLSYFETELGLGVGTLYTTITDPAYESQFFWTQPKALSIPGVSSLEAGTSNILIEPKIPGQPNLTGSLKIKSIPVIQDKNTNTGSNLVVKDITVSDQGNLLLHKGPYVEKLLGSNNFGIDKNQGTVTGTSIGIKSFETPFDDALLKGTLSKIYQNSLTSHIVFPQNRQSSVIYKKQIPSNFNRSNKITIFIDYFGYEAITLDETFTFKYSIIENQSRIDKSPNIFEKVFSFDESTTLIFKRLILLELETYTFQDYNSIYLEVIRNSANTYAGDIGIINSGLIYTIN